jgi:hypothetical protein
MENSTILTRLRVDLNRLGSQGQCQYSSLLVFLSLLTLIALIGDMNLKVCTNVDHIESYSFICYFQVNTERESIESSYSDIVAKLKRIANESRPTCDSNNNTIPFIDDDGLAYRNSYIINTDCLSARQLAFNDYLTNVNLQSTLKNPKFGMHSKVCVFKFGP